MYATAHRVIAHPRRGGQEGINAFVHTHGRAFPWPPDPWNLPERDPGVEVLRNVEVEPGGNEVRSWLDVLCPDDCTWEEVLSALTGLWLEVVADDAASAGTVPNPVVFERGRVTVRFGTDGVLAASRSLELIALRTALEQLRERAPKA